MPTSRSTLSRWDAVYPVILKNFPAASTRRGKEGEELASGKVSGNGKVSGTSEGDILFCIESVTEEMITKRCIPAMRMDFVKR